MKLVDNVEWALRMFKESATPEAVDVRQLLTECRDALSRAEAALQPFAARVHRDGVDAPYPEEEWRPQLDAAKNAYDYITARDRKR
jgi:hypothetical protein